MIAQPLCTIVRLFSIRLRLQSPLFTPIWEASFRVKSRRFIHPAFSCLSPSTYTRGTRAGSATEGKARINCLPPTDLSTVYTLSVSQSIHQVNGRVGVPALFLSKRRAFHCWATSDQASKKTAGNWEKARHKAVD